MRKRNISKANVIDMLIRKVFRNSEAEMLAFVSGACSVTGAQGRTECAKAEKPPYSSPMLFPDT